MSNLLRQTRDSGPKRILTPGPPPKLIMYRPGSPGMVRFRDDSTVTASCIGCADRPCYRYREDELSVSPLEGFPIDKTELVCPADVVSPNGKEGLPNIESDGCIMCGVCVSRCPVGAIFIDPAKGAVVQTETNRRFIEARRGQEKEVQSTRATFASVERVGTMVQENDSVASTISARSSLALRRDVRYPTLFARNLLMALGVNAVARRSGVSSMRMEILQKTVDGYLGVVEVEFGDEAVLDAPRDILDDVAVLVARHGWVRGEFGTAIITDLIPNRRSEYWRIITDIKNVVGVKVVTVSALSLVLAVWRRLKLTKDSLDSFYTDEQTESYLQNIMPRALGFKPRLSSGSNRWVDWAK